MANLVSKRLPLVQMIITCKKAVPVDPRAVDGTAEQNSSVEAVK